MDEHVERERRQSQLQQQRTTMTLTHEEIQAKLKKEALDPSLPCQRRLATRIVTSHTFELFVALVFIVNLVFIVLETDSDAEYETTNDESDKLKWLVMVNWIFLSFYCLELVVRIYVERCLFFYSPSNIIDLFVVIIDTTLSAAQVFMNALAVPSISVLRVVRFLRLLRLARALMILSAFRELYVMVHGLKAASRAIFWAIVLIFAVLLLCSIIAVQVLHPLNKEIAEAGSYTGCERCERAFSSVGQATLTFIQQIIAGDSWGLVSLPIIEAHPWTLPIFITVLLCVNLGLMNLVLTAIVDQATASREADYNLRVREKQERFDSNKGRLIKVFQEIDANGDGLLSFEELSEGFQNPECKKIWSMMDIAFDDLALVYNMMDDDGSGNVDFKEFIEQVHRMQTRDQRILVMLLTAIVHKHNDHIRREIHEMKDMIKDLSGSKREAKCIPRAPESNGQPLADHVGAYADAGSNMRNSAMLDGAPPETLNSVLLFDSLAQNIAKDVMAIQSSLRDIGRTLDKEVATNATNSDLLATMTRSLSGDAAKAAAVRYANDGPRDNGIFSTCSPTTKGREPLSVIPPTWPAKSSQRSSAAALSNVNSEAWTPSREQKQWELTNKLGPS